MYSLLSTTAKYRLSCQLNKFFQRYQFLIILMLLIFFLVLYKTIQKYQMQKYVRVAEQLYKKNLQILVNREKELIDVRDLMIEEMARYQTREREVILGELERIRSIDEQVTHVQKNGQKYWILI